MNPSIGENVEKSIDSGGDVRAYVVRSGDTLAGIALRTGVNVSSLKRMNKLYGNNVLVGQILVLSQSPIGKSEVSDSVSESNSDIGCNPEKKAASHDSERKVEDKNVRFLIPDNEGKCGESNSNGSVPTGIANADKISNSAGAGNRVEVESGGNNTASTNGPNVYHAIKVQLWNSIWGPGGSNSSIVARTRSSSTVPSFTKQSKSVRLPSKENDPLILQNNSNSYDMSDESGIETQLHNSTSTKGPETVHGSSSLGTSRRRAKSNFLDTTPPTAAPMLAAPTASLPRHSTSVSKLNQSNLMKHLESTNTNTNNHYSTSERRNDSRQSTIIPKPPTAPAPASSLFLSSQVKAASTPLAHPLSSPQDPFLAVPVPKAAPALAQSTGTPHSSLQQHSEKVRRNSWFVAPVAMLGNHTKDISSVAASLPRRMSVADGGRLSHNSTAPTSAASAAVPARSTGLTDGSQDYDRCPQDSPTNPSAQDTIGSGLRPAPLATQSSKQSLASTGSNPSYQKVSTDPRDKEDVRGSVPVPVDESQDRQPRNRGGRAPSGPVPIPASAAAAGAPGPTIASSFSSFLNFSSPHSIGGLALSAIGVPLAAPSSKDTMSLPDPSYHSLPKPNSNSAAVDKKPTATLASKGHNGKMSNRRNSVTEQELLEQHKRDELQQHETMILADLDWLHAETERLRREASITMPKMTHSSKILTNKTICQLVMKLPITLQFDTWSLVYSMLDHGADMSIFFSNMKNSLYSLVVVQTAHNEVFGGFADSTWAVTNGFYGGFECFVFRTDDGDVAAFPWTQINEFLMWSSPDQIGMGGGGDGFGFLLDSDFRTGSTSVCETYANPPLVNKDIDGFNIVNVEVWGFVSSFGNSYKGDRSARNAHR